MASEMKLLKKETKTSWVWAPPKGNKVTRDQVMIAKRWKGWLVMLSKISRWEFLSQKMRFTYPEQEIVVHELFCNRRHARTPTCTLASASQCPPLLHACPPQSIQAAHDAP